MAFLNVLNAEATITNQTRNASVNPAHSLSSNFIGVCFRRQKLIIKPTCGRLATSMMSSLFREGGRIWRRFLEGGDSRSVLRQRPSVDLLRPSRDQTGRPAEGAGVLHGVLQPLLKKSAANLQPAEKGEHLHTRRTTNIWK